MPRDHWQTRARTLRLAPRIPTRKAARSCHGGHIIRSRIPRVSSTLVRHALCIPLFRPGSLFVCWLLLLMATSPGDSRAGSSDTRSEIISADPAIGRLNHAGFRTRGHCTGFAVNTGALVTAAHCLPDIPDDTVHVLLGYEQGALQHHHKTPASAFRTLPEQDIAALCTAPQSGSSMTLAQEPPTPGTRVTIRGYGAPKVHVLQRTDCSVQTVSRSAFVILDCGLPSGASGAPVTMAETGDVIGLVSASASTRTLVSRLTPGIIDRLCG